jgi:hypothetical protein
MSGPNKKTFVPATRNHFQGTGYITSERDQEERLRGYQLVEPEKIPFTIKPSMHVKFVNSKDGALRNGGIVVSVKKDMLILKGLNDKTFPVRYPQNQIWVKVDERTVSMHKAEFLDFLTDQEQEKNLEIMYGGKKTTISRLRKAFLKQQAEEMQL